MSSAFAPLKALQSWYDTANGQVPILLYLIDGSVTSMLDSYETIDDVPGLLADTSDGIDAGSWPLNYDTTSASMELSLPDQDWTSDDTYSLSFRWIAVVLPGGYLLSLVDFGTLQTLDDESLAVYAAESDNIPNSYPIFRWQRA